LPGGSTPEWAQRLPHVGLPARAAFVVWASLFYVTPVLSMAVIALRGWRDFAGLMMLQIVLLWTADVLFWLAPSRPPWMDVDVVRIMQSQTDGAVSIDANPFAAVPSLHVAVPASYAAWFAWHPVRAARGIGAALWCWTAVMGFVVVFSGEHYLLDVVAGAAWALASYAVVRRLGWAYRPHDRKAPPTLLTFPARAPEPDGGRRAA
jgi:membrane-associated phospholipid phosphatase